MTIVLIPGADGRAWYWHRAIPELRAKGHGVVTLDMPAGEHADLDDYTDAVVDAIGNRTDLVVVGQSLGGFTAPLVCERVPVDLLVLVNAMVPSPGESAGAWWANTGHAKARAERLISDGRSPDDEFDPRADFFHDVPPDITEEALSAGVSGPSPAIFAQPWPLASWPDVPTRFLQGRDDRFFPIDFQRRIVSERLGITIDEMPGGHLVALSQPAVLAERLDTYAFASH